MERRNRFVLLLMRMALLMALYTLCRLLFLLFNLSYFRGEPAGHLLSLFFYGLRFDSTAIVISNLLFICLSVVPFFFFYNNGYQRLLKILFITFHSFSLRFNIIYLVFFTF